MGEAKKNEKFSPYTHTNLLVSRHYETKGVASHT